MIQFILIFILLAAVAFAASALSYRHVRDVAIRNGIMDKPSGRKFQRDPVPCAGGIAVFIGIFAGLMVEDPIFEVWKVTVVLTVLLVMLIIGTMDDMHGLSPAVRFAVEILMTYIFIAGTELYVANLAGLWGLHEIHRLVAFLLSILAGVGIINAINLMDGVDGLSSGFCMFASAIFAVILLTIGAPRLGFMAVITFFALIPFFLHNVFGVKSKMFLGDGGSLTLGVMLTILIFSWFSVGSPVLELEDKGICIAALVLSVMSIPVADVLRVMTSRMAHGKSPFAPDKNHLHHDFVALGFSHLGTAIAEIVLDGIVILTWYAAYKLGAGMDLQLYIVIAMAILLTQGWHSLVRALLGRDNSALLRSLQRIAASTHWEKRGWWQAVSRFMDRKY